MADSRDRIIAPKSGAALEVAAGERLRVIDIEGHQVADFVCFNADDHGEFFSAGKTRANAMRARISTGDALFSNRNNVLFTIAEDRVGVHDLLFPPCNRWLYAHVLGQPGTTGCLENLARALAPYGIAEGAVPDPFNLFMNTRVDADHRLVIERAPSKAGDHIELEAAIDCLVAVTACAEEVATDCNGRHCTPIGLEIAG